ncbi:reactive intermediate/imine deaminase [Amycolatopsis sp. NBRC 101858]|uniref:RidA family protein n=1 Tax=Amycolatopsis sp. NBRC 101858 TaxID=3032200 RepID=UPI0024A3F86B|nr:RidA family protein [Amycolatopsis sp. NBRC 101858]GLY42897.1 reactive intermediate/imine deaminase [Amycolatopsis sp. NBRC 101858]
MTTPSVSPCRRAGPLLFVSGQLGLGDAGLVPGGVAPETRQAIHNVAAVLEGHGATLADVVKSTVFLASMDDWPEMNKAYAELFGTPAPARSAVGSGLLLGARVEIEVVAYAPTTQDAP